MDFNKIAISVLGSIAAVMFGFLWNLNGTVSTIAAIQIAERQSIERMRSDLIAQISRNVDTNNTYIRANSAAIVESQIKWASWEAKWPDLAAELRVTAVPAYIAGPPVMEWTPAVSAAPPSMVVEEIDAP